VIAKRLCIRGRVQGVGYRYAAVDAAHDAGALGWVRNRGDGSVEMWIQGTAEAVDRVVAWSRRGPMGARVDDVDVTTAQPDAALRDFRQLTTGD
jgi:acylphosphatase